MAGRDLSISRRTLVLAGVTASASIFVFSGVGRPPDQFFNITDEFGSVELFGWTLIPFTDKDHVEAWRTIWAELPEEKGLWLAEFVTDIDAGTSPSLRVLEGAMRALFDSERGEKFGQFIDQIYYQVSQNRPLIDLVYVDGPHQVGHADPDILHKWGITT